MFGLVEVRAAVIKQSGLSEAGPAIVLVVSFAISSVSPGHTASIGMLIVARAGHRPILSRCETEFCDIRKADLEASHAVSQPTLFVH